MVFNMLFKVFSNCLWRDVLNAFAQLLKVPEMALERLLKGFPNSLESVWKVLRWLLKIIWRLLSGLSNISTSFRNCFEGCETRSLNCFCKRLYVSEDFYQSFEVLKVWTYLSKAFTMLLKVLEKPTLGILKSVCCTLLRGFLKVLYRFFNTLSKAFQKAFRSFSNILLKLPLKVLSSSF